MIIVDEVPLIPIPSPDELVTLIAPEFVTVLAVPLSTMPIQIEPDAVMVPEFVAVLDVPDDENSMPINL